MKSQFRSVWSDLYATEFRQGWVDAGGLKTRFIEAGSPDNPPLIMLHGTAGSWENFCLNVAAHAEHFHCFAFDMIGSGLTDKPDFDYETQHYVKHLCDFMDAMKIGRANLIGLSLGARVASRFAIDHPRRIDKLVLLSATAYFLLARFRRILARHARQPHKIPRRENARKFSRSLYTTKAAFQTILSRCALQSTAGPR